MLLFREDKGAAGNGWRRGVTHTPTGHAEAFRDTELLCVPLCLLTSRLPSGDGSKLKQLLKHGTFASDQAEQSDHLTVMFNVWFLTAANTPKTGETVVANQKMGLKLLRC